jgi:hypothetical protein
VNAETIAALALVDAGVPASTVERGLRMLDVDQHDDQASIAAKVASLRTDVPALFTGAGAPPPPAGSIPADRRPGESDHDRGVRLARERYPHLHTGGSGPAAQRAAARWEASQAQRGWTPPAA